MDPVNPNRILIVEDEALLALELEETLEQAGFQVVGVTPTCGAALEWAERHSPDLVLMDIGLAGRRDGIEAAMILQRDFGIPSLFLTGISPEDLEDRWTSAKPVGGENRPVGIVPHFTRPPMGGRGPPADRNWP
jgi:two-component system, response regulator PdtaR